MIPLVRGRLSVRVIATALLALGASAGLARAGNVLVGIDVATDRLIRIDTTTGAGVPIGPVGDASVGGLTYDSNHGILYGSSVTTGNLLRIEPATGATTVVGPFGLSSYVETIEYDALNDKLYGATSFVGTLGLYTIDPNTGAPTLLGLHGITYLTGLAFDSVNQVMYGSDNGAGIGGRLYTIDIASGSATLIGPFGNTGGVIGEGLAYDPTLGLFATDVHGGSSPPARLHRIDTLTGHATAIGNIGFDRVISLAFVPESVIPEPGSGPLFLSALGFWARHRRWR